MRWTTSATLSLRFDHAHTATKQQQINESDRELVTNYQAIVLVTKKYVATPPAAPELDQDGVELPVLFGLAGELDELTLRGREVPAFLVRRILDFSQHRGRPA